VDEVLRAEGQRPFTWGALRSAAPADVRAEYIASLVAADEGDFARLHAFVKS
jgi:hypothetical protein